MQHQHHHAARSVSAVGAVQPSLLSRCNSATLGIPTLDGGQVIQMQIASIFNYSATTDFTHGPPAGSWTNLDFCNITVTYTHPGKDDRINVQIALPFEDWNERFLGSGGRGWAAGHPADYLTPFTSRHYAAATTDGGHSVYDFSAAGWALDGDGNVNLNNLKNFAYISLIDLAEIGKQITKNFYDKAPRASYWAGCSTGGRQGLMLAQRYPEAFDGILAIAPAINWDQFVTAEYWPQQVMNRLGYFPRSCELDAIALAALEACDPEDGIQDGIVTDPDSCYFDALSLVRQPFDCNGSSSRFSAEAAKIANAAWDGPRDSSGQRQWYGIPRGSLLTFTAMGFPFALANTACSDNDQSSCQGVPWPLADEWIRLFLKKSPTFVTANLTTNEYFALFSQSVREYNDIIGTSNPDLSAFNKNGGKIISWHGLADQLIFPNGTQNYYNQVLRRDQNVADFWRHFDAPGVLHCNQGPGPCPDVLESLDAIVTWVEDGRAPATLTALSQNGDGTQRPLCPFPLKQQYDGGSPKDLQSFKCG